MTRTVAAPRRIAVVALGGVGVLLALVLAGAGTEVVGAASQRTALEALKHQAEVTGKVLAVESNIIVLRGTGLMVGLGIGLAVGSVLTFTRLSR